MAPILALMGGLALAASPADVRLGRKLFHDPSVGVNGVSCATCHATVADETAGDGLLRAGHTLWGVAERPFWRGDYRRQMHGTVADAVDTCVQLFQGGKPLRGARRRRMTAFLEQISPKAARKARKRKRRSRQPPTEARIQTALEADLDYDRPKYRNGNAARGRSLFYRACHACHPHGRAGVAPSLIGASVADVARAVREGNGLLRGARRSGAWSPSFGLNRLSHPQVADIAAYVGTLHADR